MTNISVDERHWLLCCLAQGLVDTMGVVEPPIPIEELFHNPPAPLAADLRLTEASFGWWDATFVRALGIPGTIYVNLNIPPQHRRFAIARELLGALITSDHGSTMGLHTILMRDIHQSANYFARVLLAPCSMVNAYQENGGSLKDFANRFMIPTRVAALRWDDTLPCSTPIS